MSSEASLLEAAERLAQAEAKGDIPALEQLLAPDYQGYDPSGRPQDRAGVLRGYAEGGGVKVTSLLQSDLRARVLGEAGLVAGINVMRGQQGHEHFDLRLRFLDVYAWRDGRWQLVASQDTRL
ncbi:MAG TPA: nuclear transport factor 2 family protein [Gemmatimonadales bacterium]|nr:nuclear transport factor 2 family protein [Gemmatimonadales bacterium]